MRLFRFLAYAFAFFLGTVIAFRGANTFPAPPPPQYRHQPPVGSTAIDSDSRKPLAADSLILAGKTLFMANCAQCHHRNMVDDLTGPALGDVQSRWAPYPAEDLYGWIHNSQALIDAGHPRGRALWEKWQRRVMPPFPNMPRQDVDAVLAYVDAVYAR